MRPWTIAGVVIAAGALLISHCTVKVREGGPEPAAPRVLRAVARREDGSLVGIVVRNGRLLEARLRVRDGCVVLTPPRWGIPVLGDDGEIGRPVADFLDGLTDDGGATGGAPAGVTEIELSVDPAVSPGVEARLVRFLARRGIRAVPWNDP